MSEPFVFDSRCTACKDPFGAVPCGTPVAFHCRPLTSEGFSHAALVLRFEFSDRTEELELTAEGAQAERFRFGSVFTAPAEPELIWYHFRFWREDGSGCVLDQSGYHSRSETQDWQLTVYQDVLVPAWFGRGITYQIFPDRFCRLPDDMADPTGLVGNRWVHENWSDAPVWKPDPDGEVRNRDFFGGTLRGIASKLPELSALGVTTLYLNPIFESASNHRYNTANYRAIDPLLGTEADFRALCQQAHELGMRVLLDGVFNHTGSQSIYFNADGFYPSVGAAQQLDSPYADWYSFHPWPDDYDAWWGIRTLPAVREESPSYQAYIFGEADSVVRHWLRAGADGWRLDVADELPDWFLEKLRRAVEETKPDALLLGEVWEDASNKIAYSQRRRYLLGRELHSVMNYPFRTALLDYLTGGDADTFRVSMETIREHYPPQIFRSLMNFLGTHDTARILTVLGADQVPANKGDRAACHLSDAERQRGEALVRLAVLVLFTFPGSPTIYYGDEVGMEGFEDPFNRRTMPWNHIPSPALQGWFRQLAQLRTAHTVLQNGEIDYLYTAGSILVYARRLGEQRLVTAVYTGAEPATISLPWPQEAARDLLSLAVLHAADGALRLTLPPRSGYLLAEC